MSFILDALRKSEAARRRSEAPDLFAPMPTAAADARPRAAWPLWALGIGGALALLAAIALLVLRPSPPADDTRAAVSAPDTTPAATLPPPAPTGPATGTPTAPPPMPGPTPGTIANIGPAPSPNQPLPERAPAASPPSSPAVAQSASRPAETVAPTPAPAATVGDENPRAAAARDAPAAALADLDPAARKQLPPLKLSMHLWNETPARRLVILDGQRLKEGDVIGDAVIERITRDGVVLAWRGARLTLSAE